MVNFGPKETVPEQYKNRHFYYHNPTVTLMRTTKDENEQLGKVMAEKLNKATKETVLLLPLAGVSGLDAQGQEFYDIDADQALFTQIKQHLSNPLVEVIELEHHINEEAFSEAAVETLLTLMNK